MLISVMIFMVMGTLDVVHENTSIVFVLIMGITKDVMSILIRISSTIHTYL